MYRGSPEWLLETMGRVLLLRFAYKRLFSRFILCAMRNFMPWQFSSCTGFAPERVETQSSSWSVSLYMIFFFRIIWRWQGNEVKENIS